LEEKRIKADGNGECVFILMEELTCEVSWKCLKKRDGYSVFVSEELVKVKVFWNDITLYMQQLD
jgi:hypothetical protein